VFGMVLIGGLLTIVTWVKATAGERGHSVPQQQLSSGLRSLEPWASASDGR
jgi:hypothetical protein